MATIDKKFSTISKGNGRKKKKRNKRIRNKNGEEDNKEKNTQLLREGMAVIEKPKKNHAISEKIKKKRKRTEPEGRRRK